VQPLGYALAGITFVLPLAIIGSLLARGSTATLAMVAVTAIARLMLNSAPRNSHSLPVQLGLAALSDMLGFVLWCWSFATRRVHWRDMRYRIARDGTIQPLPESVEP